MLKETEFLIKIANLLDKNLSSNDRCNMYYQIYKETELNLENLIGTALDSFEAYNKEKIDYYKNFDSFKEALRDKGLHKRDIKQLKHNYKNISKEQYRTHLEIKRQLEQYHYFLENTQNIIQKMISYEEKDGVSDLIDYHQEIVRTYGNNFMSKDEVFTSIQYFLKNPYDIPSDNTFKQGIIKFFNDAEPEIDKKYIEECFPVRDEVLYGKSSLSSHSNRDDIREKQKNKISNDDLIP